MACPKCEYKPVYKYIYDDANGNHVLWILPVVIKPYIIQNEHIHYCPMCGMELPTDAPEAELDLEEAARSVDNEYQVCG